MPGRSRLMCAARATHTENDKPVENAPMYQGADLLHRQPCDNHSVPVQYSAHGDLLPIWERSVFRRRALSFSIGNKRTGMIPDRFPTVAKRT